MKVHPAELAERYGWVNRAVADQDLDALVDKLARRIASYDKACIAVVKEQINRHTLPSPEDMVSSLQIYLDSFDWPGSKRRREAALAAGRNRPGDYELRMGYHLGQPLDD